MIPPAEVKAELLRMTDLYTDELTDWPDRLVFSISRLICDVERFRDKQMESMTQKGMWVCYTHTSDGNLLKIVNPAHENDILNRFYEPHHKSLTKMAEDRIRLFDCCTIVDLHSFFPTPLPYEPSQDANRPDICIGTDSFHTPRFLKEATANFFGERGYSTTFDRPYSGTITPLSMYRQEPRLYAIMIELNRSLYMDARTGVKNAGFIMLKSCMSDYLNFVDSQLKTRTVPIAPAQSENRKIP